MRNYFLFSLLILSMFSCQESADLIKSPFLTIDGKEYPFNVINSGTGLSSEKCVLVQDVSCDFATMNTVLFYLSDGEIINPSCENLISTSGGCVSDASFIVTFQLYNKSGDDTFESYYPSLQQAVFDFQAEEMMPYAFISVYNATSRYFTPENALGNHILLVEKLPSGNYKFVFKGELSTYNEGTRNIDTHPVSFYFECNLQEDYFLVEG